MIALSALSFSKKDFFSTPLSTRIANYDISVKLNAEEKTLEGKEILYWKNPSPDTITELQFHLYLNAFKNTQSTFMKEGGRNMPTMDAKENIWGWIDISSMTDEAGNDLTAGMKFIHPDDDNIDDQTVVSVPLPKPILPNGEIKLNIDFTAKLPKVIARTGYSKNFFLVAQWFPKIGVYEPAGMRYAKKGQWNCHQFHARSEFYADFGIYNVDITVPADYVVGATGSLQVVDANEGTKTYFYRAEDVIDFAWTCSPDYVVKEDQWNDVSIRLLIPPEHEQFSERYLSSAKNALEYFDKNIGKYPYATLTIVDPPLHGAGATGMEYPTFITGMSFYGMPDELRFAEMVTIHEFGHQYFMGMLASNEFEEPWLDEGFNSYLEGRIMDHYYGEKNSVMDFWAYQTGNFEMQRNNYLSMDNPKIAENFRPSWEFKHGGYGSLTYAKTATWMKTLEGLVGIETMDEIMKTYFERWKFKHPCATDFIAIVNEIVQKNHGKKFGENMNWFFDQVLYSAEICDYQLVSVSNTKIKKELGIFENKTAWVSADEEETTEDEDENTIYKSSVVIYRMGEVIMPVEVLVHFENGEEKLETWDGKSRSHEFSYEGTNEVLWAQIDPEEKIYMDKNFINNSYTTKPENTGRQKYGTLFLFWVQNVMQSLSMLI